MKFLQVPQGTILKIRVKPRSRRFEIKLDDEIVVLCREPPIKGRVNRELVKELSRLFGKRVEIISGFRSKQKRILVRDAETEEVMRVLKCGRLE